MITIKGKSLRKSDKKAIRTYTNYCLDKLISAPRRKAATIQIYVVSPKTLKASDKKDLEGFKAFMQSNIGADYKIFINEDQIKRSAKRPETRLKNVLLCLGHEMVHVKQYVMREMFDYKNGDVWFKGFVYSDWDNDEDYYFLAWEIEAYGHELGLYVRFLEEVGF